VTAPTFYFFNDRTAIRFHISRGLLSRGWQCVGSEKAACFSDRHLTLNDAITIHLEYKHLLAQLVAQYCPSIMPLTYCIDDTNYSEVFAKIIYENYLQDGHYVTPIKNLSWILKPALLNNGDHIKLFNAIETLKQYYASPHRLGGAHVVQRYLSEPALIDNRKYTFRMPVIVTNYAGIFLYNQGYVNICALPFKADDFADRKAHISNYVLDGQLSHIEQRSTQSLENFDAIVAQMKSIVTKVMQALLKKYPAYLQPKSHKSFEIFGFDFMQDAKGKLWLLEINQGPDAPTFEENALLEILWKPFWKDILGDFVEPVALGSMPLTQYKNFTQVLDAKKCYSVWDNVLYNSRQWLGF